MLRLGLIGYPLEHSLSPRLHQAALQACGIAGEYCLYPVPPGEERPKRLADLFGQVRMGELQGLNVTIPLKQEVLPLMDILRPAAAAIGAVNTIYKIEGRLVGENTDAAGFWIDLCRNELIDGASPGNAMILGAGGAARAVAYALCSRGWQVTVAARRREQAQALINNLQENRSHLAGSNEWGILSAIGTEVLPDLASRKAFQLVVNATPLGMFPHADASPLPAGLSHFKGAFIYDLVYNPAVTRLIKQGKQAGLSVSNGLGMLVEQAALAFECWSGVKPPVEAMRRAVNF